MDLSGTQQAFVVPTGSTRLFVGSMDESVGSTTQASLQFQDAAQWRPGPNPRARHPAPARQHVRGRRNSSLGASAQPACAP